MKNNKILIINGAPFISPPKSPSPALSSLSAMTVGAWGDPHMYISVSSLDNKKRTVTKKIAQWGDNKQGASGNNELKLLDLETSTDIVKIYYTNKNWTSVGGKVIASIRVEHNGASTTYTNTTKLSVGPVQLNILKQGSGANAYLNFEISWNNINNVIKLAGAIVVVLKRVAANNGKPWNGGDGRFWDGIGRAASAYGLSRSSFETGIGIQSTEPELFISSSEADFISVIGDNFIQDTNIFDEAVDQGENGEGDNAPVSEWDDTYTDAVATFSSIEGLEGAIDAELYYTPSGQNIEV